MPSAFPAYFELRQHPRKRTIGPQGEEGREAKEPGSPQDVVANAQPENRAAIEGELASRALCSPPRTPSCWSLPCSEIWDTAGWDKSSIPGARRRNSAVRASSRQAPPR